MGSIRDAAERLWAGTETTHDLQPVSLMLGLEPWGDGLAFLSSFGNVVVLDTSDGLVLIDTGGFFLAGQTHAQVREFSQGRLHTAIYTHGHVDHAFGVPPFDDDARAAGTEPPRVIAHEAVVARFDRYQRTAGYNLAINRRQFGAGMWPQSYRYPDLTYRDRLDVEIGGEPIELYHARGETDDHTWAWMPQRKVLCTGDLFIWASPNCGNPQKVQRYPHEWSAALRQMATLGAETLMPGHGLPISGQDRVERALSETAELLELLVEETLSRMNAGLRLDQILAEVRPPARLLQRPYLRPVYDEPEFIVRNLWRLYGGWWDGNPAALKPAREAELARELAELSGGAVVLAERARELGRRGELALACHLVELAVQADPTEPVVLAARGEVYSARADAETSLMARAIYRAAAEGR